MSGKLLLDTIAVIGIFANDPDVLAIVSQASECFLPSVVIGEFYYGTFHSARVLENLATLQSFCDTLAVLPCDAATAIEYGRIMNELRSKGRPIPENDLWIAALAAQHKLNLLSSDEHFDTVASLTRRSW